MKSKITGFEISPLDKRVKVMVSCPVCGVDDDRIYTKDIRVENDAALCDGGKIPIRQNLIVNCYCNNCQSKFDVYTDKAIVVGLDKE